MAPNPRSWFFNLSPEQKQSIIDRYLSNESTKTIADSFGVSRSNILYFLKTKKVKLRPKSKWNEYTYDRTFFDKIDTEEKAYTLGFLYADGCVYERTYRVSTELAIRDIDILEKMRVAMKSNYIFTYCHKKNKFGEPKKYVTFSINDKDLIPKVKKLGLEPRKSATLKFPTCDQVPDHLVHHFIRGYFDGDGSLSFKRRADELTDSYLSLSIISTLDFCSKIKEIMKFGNIVINNQSDGMYYYRIGKSAVGVYNFLSYIYKDATIFLKRKHDKYKEFLLLKKDFQRQTYCKSKFFGVQTMKTGKFLVKVRNGSVVTQIGTFKNELEAAIAYDDFCIKNKINSDKLNFDGKSPEEYNNELLKATS